MHSKMQIRVQDLKVASPLDIETPIRQLGGNVSLYYMMLGRLEDMSLITNMKAIAIAVDS